MCSLYLFSPLSSLVLDSSFSPLLFSSVSTLSNSVIFFVSDSISSSLLLLLSCLWSSSTCLTSAHCDFLFAAAPEQAGRDESVSRRSPACEHGDSSGGATTSNALASESRW